MKQGPTQGPGQTQNGTFRFPVFSITSKHIHFIVFANDEFQVAECMRQAAGETARDYNRLTARSEAFWEGRYYATMVDSGEYLWESA